MAKFRMVDTDFWNDPDIQENFTPEDKLFYLYLMTNPATKQIGIYTITKKKMAFELGYSIETVNSLMSRFLSHHKLIDYDEDTREILLLRWSETAFRKGGKPVNDLILSEMNTIKRVDWIARVAPLIPIESVKEVVLKYMKDNGIERYDESSNESSNESYHESYDDTPTRTKKEELRTKNQELRIKHSVQQAELFEQWWNLYGVKVGKKKCATKYNQLLKDIPHDRMMNGTQSYLEYRKELSKRNAFCPQQKNPITFLNGEHFDDDYAELLKNAMSNAPKSFRDRIRELDELEADNNGHSQSNEAAFARTRNDDGTPAEYQFSDN